MNALVCCSWWGKGTEISDITNFQIHPYFTSTIIAPPRPSAASASSQNEWWSRTRTKSFGVSNWRTRRFRQCPSSSLAEWTHVQPTSIPLVPTDSPPFDHPTSGWPHPTPSLPPQVRRLWAARVPSRHLNWSPRQSLVPALASTSPRPNRRRSRSNSSINSPLRIGRSRNRRIGSLDWKRS